MPPAHHVRVQDTGRVAVWAGPRIDFVRPSADVAFTSLETAVGARAIAVILSGCGSDGAMGSRRVRCGGGVVIAEDDRSAAYSEMPVAAVDIGHVDLILPANRIASALMHLTAALTPTHPLTPPPIIPLKTA